MTRALPTALIAICLLAPGAGAVDFAVHGFADFRVVAPGDERSWLDGGLGKTRFGAGNPDGDLALRVPEANLMADLTPLKGLHLYGHVRAERYQRTQLDVIEAFARWRPTLGGRSPVTVRVGAFFPPISLENDGPGWTSIHTLSPSAINTWVGEELRTIGAEVRYATRIADVGVDLIGALFGWNDPAGLLLADKGWGIHDRWTGLIEQVRLPDNFAPAGRVAKADMFREIDDRAGWYFGANIRHRDLPRVTFLRYDNNGDPDRRRVQVAWDTRFWSLGLEHRFGDVILMAQAMVGETVVAPTPASKRVTDFESAYVLAGYTMGSWTFGARFDAFGTSEATAAARPVRFGEHGKAYTASARYDVNRHLSLTAEMVRTDSRREQRRLLGGQVERTDTQAQLVARVGF